jgi:tetratricopeptide (TPR) repeat protein
VRKGLAFEPNNVLLLGRSAGDELQLGQWAAGTEHYRKAALLDPQNAALLSLLGNAELRQRHYPQADSATARSLALTPDNLFVIEQEIVLHLMRGDLSGARAVTHRLPVSVDPSALVAYLGTYEDLGWVLDRAQERLLLSLGDDAFDNDPVARAIVFAQQYRYRGDSSRMRAYADTARVGFARQLEQVPSDHQRQVIYGLALSYLGRKAEAISYGEKSVGTSTTTSNTIALYDRHQLARIYLALGEKEKALDNLEILLKVPYYLSPERLRIDPNFAPLRGNPRFERMAAGAALAN